MLTQHMFQLSYPKPMFW